MTPLLAKFPFNSDATVEAPISDVAALLAPGTGALWALHQERLDPLMEKQGAQWIAKPGAPVALSAPFLTFFNRAAAISAALFGGASEPRIVLTARGVLTAQVTQVTLTHGSHVAQFNRDTPPAQLVWPPQSGRDARLIARVGRRELLIAEATGDWALFRLVSRASRTDGSGAAIRAEWSVPAAAGVPVAVEFVFAAGHPVLQRGTLAATCVAQVTR
jgi:type VI secretion system protein ImpL